MEGPLVSVSMGVMKRLLAKLAKLLEEEYEKLRGVSKQIKFLRDELRAMSPALEMLGDVQELSPLMRYWRDELRELAYDMEDCVDKFMARVADQDDSDGPTGLLGLFNKFKKLVTRHEIADEIEELKRRVVEVSERHKRYNFVELTSKPSSSAVDPRLPALYEEIDRLVGIGEPKKQIIKLLQVEINGSSAKLRVVSITGCGGIGKTTLAKQVYDTVKAQFSCAAFVLVSQTPDVLKILRDIAKQVGLKHKTRDDERQLIDKLKQRLQDKRYLVVFDDVWDAKAWEFVKLALPDDDCGSRIITTTRNTTIALHFSCQGGKVYQMKPLCFVDSKRLLFKRAFGSENLQCSHNLGSVPDDILRKCDGLPLAIITISSILTDQHEKSEWDRVLNDIGSALAKNPGAGNMTTILSLSYLDIPQHLRTCLLYLSVFPEDCRIEKQHLITRWIAEGFLHEDEGRTKYEIGEGYFNDLINRSMVQPVDVKYGQAKACRVHDIILDYIKCKAREENFVTSFNAAKHRYTQKYKQVRRLCVNNNSKEHVTQWATSLVRPHVRSVTIFGQAVQTSMFSSTALRVLDLGDCEDVKDNHLASIERLLLLKYLRLRSSSINNLPYKIGELKYLQTLDLRHTTIDELPPSITKLQQLAHLYVDWNVRFPDGMIGHMLCLEELREYGVFSYKQGQSLQEFSKLTKLRTLKIKWSIYLQNVSEGTRQPAGIHGHVRTLLSTCNLHNLYISNTLEGCYPLSLDSWQPATHCSLRKLWIKGGDIYKVPNWMGSLGNLKALKLKIICLGPDDLGILGAIPTLLFLNLGTNGGTDGRIIVHSSNGFRNLKYFSLKIMYCGTTLEFQAGSMPNLDHVILEFPTHEIACHNGASTLGIQHLHALSKVEVGINGNHPADDMADGSVRYLANAINAAVQTIPNRPTLRFRIWIDPHCERFDPHIRLDRRILTRIGAERRRHRQTYQISFVEENLNGFKIDSEKL